MKILYLSDTLSASALILCREIQLDAKTIIAKIRSTIQGLFSLTE
jgi:hypothetical protein